jgi:hypothetical protein
MAGRDGKHRPSRCRRRPGKSSQILPQPLEERVPHLALGRLRPVLDLRQQLHPDALVRDLLAVGLRLPDQGRQLLLKLRRRDLVEALLA